MRKYVFMLIVVVGNVAWARVSSGTIIITNLTKDQTIVAADSLSRDTVNLAPNYSECKVAVFSHQVIFATVGAAIKKTEGSVQGWNNSELARAAIESAGKNMPEDNLLNVTRQWVIGVTDLWKSEYKTSPETVIRYAGTHDGQVTAGIFIGKGSRVEVGAVQFSPSTGVYGSGGEDISGCLPCGQSGGAKICGSGAHLDVMAKFCSERNPGDKIEVRTTLKNASDGVKLAVKIVELTIDAYGKTPGDVGGVVDSVSISKAGEITWHSRKSNCPENQ